jgi:hypothetical protein
MVLNKLKKRNIGQGKHGKYTKRKGCARIYHRKNKKHYTRKYGKRIQRRRQTRSKRGGELTLNIPNMNTPVTILYRYFARITKPNVDSFSEDDKPEQIIMYTQQSEPNSIFIARCPSKDCSTETDVKIMELDYKSLKKYASKREYFFSSGGIKYKMKIDDDGVGEPLLDFFKEYTMPISEKEREFQTSLDSINFLQPGIDDIRKMLKVTNETTCPFLCNPDECDETMLEKLRQKYMEKIKGKEIQDGDDAIEIFYDTLDKNLLLILENFYVQSQTLTKEKLTNLFSQCDQNLSYSLNDSSSTHKNLHGIVNMLYKKIRNSIITSDVYLEQNFENMKKLLQLLNSMTPENMQKLLQLLNSMTPANMQKLLQLLNSMTPENMQKLLQLLNSMTPANMGIILQALNSKFNYVSNFGVQGPNSTIAIGLLLDIHLGLDPESMSKLLDFYSFSEIKQSVDPKSKIVRYDIICHKYKGGKTPLFKSISKGKEDPSTCKAIKALNEIIPIITQFFKHIKGKLDNVDVRTSYDPKLLEAYGECRDRYYQEGGKRKTLKKRRRVKK